MSNGHTQFLPSEKKNLNKNELLDQICICLGGRAAELLELDITVEGCKDDIAQAQAIAIEMIHSEAMGSMVCGSMNDVEEILQKQLNRAKNILEENQEAWKKVMDALVSRP